jgi:antitoxin component YwqK of YwqJK toxin-antitoxin module
MLMRLFLVVCLAALLRACDREIETVTVRNDYGEIERYERRKKDYARHGVYRRFDAQGRLREEAYYANDTLHGVRTLYYLNGRPEQVEHYERGVHHGPVVFYHENGRKHLEQTFVNGVLEGISWRWYPNGVLREKVTLRDNEENGPFVEWYENGNLKAEGTYLEGDNEHDTLRLYDVNGQLERLLWCQKGRCQTLWRRDSSVTRH